MTTPAPAPAHVASDHEPVYEGGSYLEYHKRLFAWRKTHGVNYEAEPTPGTGSLGSGYGLRAWFSKNERLERNRIEAESRGR